VRVWWESRVGERPARAMWEGRNRSRRRRRRRRLREKKVEVKTKSRVGVTDPYL
jgi:hypothetical protein